METKKETMVLKYNAKLKIKNALFALDYFIWKFSYRTQQEIDCKAENLTPQRHMGKQIAEKSKTYLVSKSRSNWEYITIL